MVDRGAVDLEQLIEKPRVSGLGLAGADVLGVVGPVAVGADPDLEERWLVYLDRPGAGCGEGTDPGARPDEAEREGELDPAAAPARAAAVDMALPECCGLGLGHPRAQVLLGVLHRLGGELVGEADPLDLLRCLDRPRAVEQRRRVDRMRERVEPCLRVGRGLADHPVARLRAERELEAHAVVLPCGIAGELERPERWRPWVALVVAGEEPDVIRPGVALGIVA